MSAETFLAADFQANPPCDPPQSWVHTSVFCFIWQQCLLSAANTDTLHSLSLL